MIADLCNWLATDGSGVMLSLFFCLAVGKALGNIKIGVFSLGSTVGTLLVAVGVALLVGSYAQYQVPPILGSLFFCFFVFALGYDVGPAFVRSLKTNGIKLIFLSLFFSVVSFGLGVGCYYAFQFGVGELVGMFAGSLTHSTILGAAQTMMASLGIVGETAQQMNADMTAAYAVGYLISYAGCVVLIKSVLPAMMGCKDANALKAQVKMTMDKTAHKAGSGAGAVLRSVRQRTFVIGADSSFAGVSVDAFERQYAQRVQIETVLRDAAVADGVTPPVAAVAATAGAAATPTPSGAAVAASTGAMAPASTAAVSILPFTGQTRLAAGEIIALIGDLDALATITTHGLIEVADAKYQQATMVQDCMTVTKDMDAAKVQALFDVNVLPTSATRNGKQLADLSQFKHGDVVNVMGTKTSVEKIIKEHGYRVDHSEASDTLYMSLGMVLGVVLGALTFKIAGVPLSFGASGGILFLGIFCGWLNDKKPNIGHVSTGARWLMKSVGLDVFVACLGLSSGLSFLSSVQTMGVKLVIAVVIVSFLPHIITVFFGKLVLRLDTVDILGGLCGAGTNTGALGGLEDETGSSIFAAACTPAYAMANISLTFIGSLCVAFFF